MLYILGMNGKLDQVFRLRDVAPYYVGSVPTTIKLETLFGME
jgi:hypothetical protein